MATIEHLNGEERPTEHVVAFQQDKWIDLVRIDYGHLALWRCLPVDENALAIEFKCLASQHGAALPLITYGFAADRCLSAELDASEIIGNWVNSNRTYDDLVLATAERIALGECQTPIELKRDAFGSGRHYVALRRHSNALWTSIAVFTLLVAGALLWRGHLANHEADNLALREVNAYRRIFPNSKVPVGIRGRLQSEFAKLNGLQGNDESIATSASAISILHDLLTSLPTECRFRVLEIRIEDGRLFMDAEVREHGDAEVIAQRLRANGFDVTSPRTQRVDGKRVALRINGTVQKPASESPRGAS